MQFLVISRPRADFVASGFPSDFEELELKEQAHAQTLYSAGSLRQLWALVREGRGAAVIFEAGSPEDMEKLFKTFPLVKVGYADYEILQLAPYPGFGHKS